MIFLLGFKIEKYPFYLFEIEKEKKWNYKSAIISILSIIYILAKISVLSIEISIIYKTN